MTMKTIDHKSIIAYAALPEHVDAIASLARQLLTFEKSLDPSMGELTPWAGERKEIAKQMRRPNTKFFIAEIDGQVIGYIKVVAIGVRFPRSETGTWRWMQGAVEHYARRVFAALSNHPRHNVDHLGGYIAGIFVHPMTRRTRVGRLLVEKAEDWLRAHGITDCDLHVLLANDGARQFWEELGYQPVATAMRKQVGSAPDETNLY